VRLSRLVQWPIIGLLHKLQMTNKYGEFVEWGLAGETEVLKENLPQYYFAHHKSHMTWYGIDPMLESGWITAQAMACPLSHLLHITVWYKNG
jgi:hypothetical protein